MFCPSRQTDIHKKDCHTREEVHFQILIESIKKRIDLQKLTHSLTSNMLTK